MTFFLYQAGNLVRCQKYAQTGLASWIPSLRATKKPISEITRHYRPWIHSEFPTRKLTGGSSCPQSRPKEERQNPIFYFQTTPETANPGILYWQGLQQLWKWDENVVSSAFGQLGSHLKLLPVQGVTGAAGEDFADLPKDVVGWWLSDPELAAVSSSGLAQPVTGREDCVSPSGEAAVGSWCWSNEAWVRWVKRSGLIFSMSRGCV